MKKHLILSALLLLAAPASAQVGSGANITFGPNCSNSTAATAGNCVQRDANGNAFANIAVSNAASTVSAGGTTVLTAASAYGQSLTGSLAQTFQLPDARTLWIGPAFAFNNNSSQSLTITNAGGSTVYVVPAGGLVIVGPTDISTANGSWDARPQPPLTVTWGSGTTGLVMNSALNTTGAIGAGASSCTAPNFVPQRVNTTTGFGSSASTNVCGVAAGTTTFTSTATTFNIPSGAAYQIGGIPVFGSGIISLGNAQSISGTLAQVAFDTLGYDTFGICDYTSTKGLCTVTSTTAGKYRIHCSVRVDMTTGPAVGALMAQVRVWKNGAAVSGGLGATYAQVASIASAQAYAQGDTVVALANGDTFACAASSAGTGPTAAASSGGSFLSYNYIGP